MDQTELVLFGSNDHAKVLIEAASLQGTPVVALYDDDEERFGRSVLDVQVVGGRSELLTLLMENDKTKLVIAIGDNKKRASIASLFSKNYSQFSNIVHPAANISKSAEMGYGTVVLANAVVGSCVKVARNVIVNTSASIDHDYIIGENTHVSPGATLCGNVKLGKNVWVGAGSVIVPQINVGSGSIIAAGSSVIYDVPENVLVAGCPAVVKKQLHNEQD